MIKVVQTLVAETGRFQCLLYIIVRIGDTVLLGIDSCDRLSNRKVRCLNMPELKGLLS